MNSFSECAPSLPGVGLMMALLLGGGLLALISLVVVLALSPPPWKSRLAELKARAWPAAAVGRLLLPVIGLNAALFSIHALLQAWSPECCSRAQPVFLVIGTLLFQGTILLLVPRLLQKQGRRFSENFGFRPRRWRDALKGGWGYLALLPIVAVGALAWKALLRYFGIEAPAQEALTLIAFRSSGMLKVYFIFIGALVAPLAEELLFRGVLLPALARKFGAGAGLLFSAMIFSALHFNVAVLIPIFLLGLAFGAAYLVTGRLGVSIVMHLLFNSVNLAVVLTAPEVLNMGIP